MLDGPVVRAYNAVLSPSAPARVRDLCCTRSRRELELRDTLEDCVFGEGGRGKYSSLYYDKDLLLLLEHRLRNSLGW